MNITLIGNPGSGKSHIGSILAKNLNFDFVDIDTQIELAYSKKLHEVLDVLGEDKFIQEESRQVLSLNKVVNTVISPGGSIVYSEVAMIHLKDISKIVYLDASFKNVISRINTKNRGIVGLGKKSFEELFSERDELYRKYADVVIGADENAGRIVEKIVREFNLGVGV